MNQFYYPVPVSLWQQAQQVRLLIMDVDGVLTDGKIFIRDNGEEIKAFHTLDGHGIKKLHQFGLQTAIITGRDAPSVAYRAEQLGINYYFAGIQNKFQVFQKLLKQTQLTAQQCAYIGDDVVDLAVMKEVGLAVCVPQAHPFVKMQAHYITHAQAGNGAVRELCDLLLTAHIGYLKLMNES